jgi:hypothetical protein
MTNRAWSKTRSYKKWSKNVERAKTKKLVRSPKDMCASSSFCKGAKDIPRKLMPQIYDAGAFAKTIKSKYGVKSAIKKVEVGGLRPSQNEISYDRVSSVIKAIKDGSLDKNPMVVSADGYVVDGHHRWAAYKKHSPMAKLPVLVIDLPIKEALGLAIAVSNKRESF